MKNTFIISLFITILARSLTWHEFSLWVPYTEIYIVYIGFWLFMILIDGKHIPIRKSTANVTLLSLLIYYVFFGLSNINNIDFSDAIDVMLKSILMILFCFVTIYWVNRFNCFDSCVMTIYYAMTCLLVFLFIIYIREVNLEASISNFWIGDGQLRYRTNFGFLSANIPAEYALTTIILSLYMINKYKNMKRELLFYIILDILMVTIILANNSRGTLLALLMCVFFTFLIYMFRNEKKAIIFTGTGAVIVGIFALFLIKTNTEFLELLESTNRLHFLNNIQALANSGRWLLGLGNISGSYFQFGSVLYGVQLNYMEIFYIGVFVTSGIIGSIWMFLIIRNIIVSFFKISKIKSSFRTKWISIIIFYMLFISLYEQYMFSYSYITATMFLIIVLSFLSDKKINDVR